jgi:hypothetical protein
MEGKVYGYATCCPLEKALVKIKVGDGVRCEITDKNGRFALTLR